MISPIGHRAIFARKQPLRCPHAWPGPLPNPFDSVLPCCQSRQQTPRCDVATTSPSPTPRRLPHGRQKRRSGQARAATGPRRCTIRMTPGGPHGYRGRLQRSALEQRAPVNHAHTPPLLCRHFGEGGGIVTWRHIFVLSLCSRRPNRRASPGWRARPAAARRKQQPEKYGFRSNVGGHRRARIGSNRCRTCIVSRKQDGL